MKNTIKKTNWINVLVIAAVAFGTALVALTPSPSPVQAEAVTITTNATTEYTVQSYNYPSSTISGISNNIPDNAVIVELGYGSDEDNNYMAATVGEFYQKSNGATCVSSQPCSSDVGVRTTGGAKVNYRLTNSGTEGVIVSLNAPFSTWVSPPDTYLTRWGWASSHTSGGTPAPGPDNFPVNVCVHAKYKLYDPVTHVIDNSQTYESGNCSSMQYNPSWIRAKVVADPNTFFTAIGQFQIGHDANLHGARAHVRQISSQTLTLDAAYVSDTVPRTPLAVSTQYQSQIRMKNTSSAMWAGDSFERTSGNCDNFPITDPQQGQTATQEGEQCTETYKSSSDVYKLRRVDADPRVTAPAELDFEHTVTRILEASLEEVIVCTDNDGGGDGGGDVILLSSKESWFDKIANWILPEAKALIRPPTGGGETCASNGYEMRARLVSGGDFNVDPNEEVDFPITFTTQASPDGGPVSLEYKMVKKGDDDVMFGDTATIPVSVSTGPSFGFTCGVDQSVIQGVTANYALSATTPSGYTNTINVTMGSDPAGATMTTTPIALSPSSLPLPYTGTAVVPTSGLAAGTYILTFTGNDGTGTKTCQAQLTVSNLVAHPDLKFNGSDGPTSPTPSTGSTGTLTWTTENAASCTGSMQTGADTSSPAWIGARAEANLEEQTFNVTGLQPNTTYIFKIECVNSLGQAGTPDTVEVSVTGQPAEPTATLECMGENNKHPIDGPCTVAIGGSGLLFWDSSYASSCSIDPDFGSVATSETDGQSTSTVKEDTTYTLTCEGASGTTPATDSVQIVVDDESAPNPPIVSTDNTVCGTITVSWTPGSTPPDITNYKVFNSTTSSSGPWTPISDLLDSSVTSFPHTTTTASNNYYMVLAYNGATPSADSNAELGNSLSCTPVIDASDKDVVSVDGKIDKNFKPTACSGTSEIASFLPSNALFSEGDRITFKINVCNSGALPLTGVSVTDTLEKLTEPSTPTSSCTLTNYNYDGNKTMTFNLSNVPAKDPDSSLPSVCSVTFTARVTAPTSGTAALYRFQNIADIRTNELAVKRVLTPPYLFSITGGVPDRTETAPQ